MDKTILKRKIKSEGLRLSDFSMYHKAIEIELGKGVDE